MTVTVTVRVLSTSIYIILSFSLLWLPTVTVPQIRKAKAFVCYTRNFYLYLSSTTKPLLHSHSITPSLSFRENLGWSQVTQVRKLSVPELGPHRVTVGFSSKWRANRVVETEGGVLRWESWGLGVLEQQSSKFICSFLTTDFRTYPRRHSLHEILWIVQLLCIFWKDYNVLKMDMLKLQLQLNSIRLVPVFLCLSISISLWLCRPVSLSVLTELSCPFRHKTSIFPVHVHWIIHASCGRKAVYK